jgi:hypothetical protein
MGDRTRGQRGELSCSHVGRSSLQNYPPQSREYQSWEREILAAEEMILDALCFDLIIKNPWVHLRKSIADITLLEEPQTSAAFRQCLQETAKALLIDG